MKNVLFSALLGLGLLLLAGCGEDAKTDTKIAETPVMKCDVGKCGAAMDKDKTPATTEDKGGSK